MLVKLMTSENDKSHGSMMLRVGAIAFGLGTLIYTGLGRPVLLLLFTGVHGNENPIYVFPEKELRSLSPNFHIHVSVSDFYIPRIGPHIFLQQKRQTNCGNI
jgi:hypothetical protein